KVTDINSLNRKLGDIFLTSIPLPFDIYLDPDQKNTSIYKVYFRGASTILPDTTYYKEEMAQQKEMMVGLWSQMAIQILILAGLSQEEAGLYVQDALAFDEVIAKYAKSSEEWSDYPSMYNPMKASRVNILLKPIKFKKLLMKLFNEVPETIIVTEPRYLKAFGEIFNENKLEQYKHWAYVNCILHASSLLSEQARDIGSMFQRALMGIQVVTPLEKFAYQLAGGFYNEPVGLYYGEKYFGEEAKKDVVDMVNDIIKTYKNRIANNDFLEESTKEKAILKLSVMRVKMGYPDKVDPIYSKMVYDESLSLFENVSNFKKIVATYKFSKLNEEVDRDEWVMSGNTVNACYNPFTNDITFPAAILQAPFYSIKQTRSENLGGIGAVIAHEISHAFDNNGAKCDEKGNLNNWWTKQDTRKFNQKTKAMIKEFDGIELPQGKVNGAFVVSENIADNGGMACTLEIMSTMDGANYVEYFTNWAKVWCMKAKPEYLQLLIQIDVHAPAYLRANMQPRNFPEWYETFNVKKTDKMYLAPNKRVVIW
ncbi:MAG: M13 family metallopeptidase, partial [Bacilli bacterium]|nr:M13 family metallopeptidase [Bacilli bacterium]